MKKEVEIMREITRMKKRREDSKDSIRKAIFTYGIERLKWVLEPSLE